MICLPNKVFIYKQGIWTACATMAAIHDCHDLSPVHTTLKPVSLVSGMGSTHPHYTRFHLKRSEG